MGPRNISFIIKQIDGNVNFVLMKKGIILINLENKLLFFLFLLSIIELQRTGVLMKY